MVARYVELPEAPRARTLETLRLMAGLVREAVSDADLVLHARRVALSGGLGREGQASALLAWVQVAIRYVLDPWDVEVLATPARVLEERSGDCDESSTLLAALCRAVGIPVRFVAVTFDERDPEWRHVYCEIEVRPGVWYAADPTVPGLRLGSTGRRGLRAIRVMP